MTVQLVAEPDYRGRNGISLLRQVQRDIIEALHAENWQRVRELDQTCAALVERMIAANLTDPSTLVSDLSEKKGVYAYINCQCQHLVFSMVLYTATLYVTQNHQ